MPFELSEAPPSFLQRSPEDRPRTVMFVVLHANGAPERIRTSDPQIRSLRFSDNQECSFGIITCHSPLTFQLHLQILGSMRDYKLSLNCFPCASQCSLRGQNDETHKRERCQAETAGR